MQKYHVFFHNNGEKTVSCDASIINKLKHNSTDNEFCIECDNPDNIIDKYVFDYVLEKWIENKTEIHKCPYCNKKYLVNIHNKNIMTIYEDPFEKERMRRIQEKIDQDRERDHPYYKIM